MFLYLRGIGETTQLTSLNGKSVKFSTAQSRAWWHIRANDFRENGEEICHDEYIDGVVHAFLHIPAISA